MAPTMRLQSAILLYSCNATVAAPTVRTLTTSPEQQANFTLPLQELVSSQALGTDPGAAKALVAARLAGLTLEAKSDSSAVHSVQLRLPHGTLFGENAVARQVALLAEAGLYPANPYAEQSRHSAALIDGWIEFSANEIQRRLQLLFAAATPEVRLHFQREASQSCSCQTAVVALAQCAEI